MAGSLSAWFAFDWQNCSRAASSKQLEVREFTRDCIFFFWGLIQADVMMCGENHEPANQFAQTPPSVSPNRRVVLAFIWVCTHRDTAAQVVKSVLTCYSSGYIPRKECGERERQTLFLFLCYAEAHCGRRYYCGRRYMQPQKESALRNVAVRYEAEI